MLALSAFILGQVSCTATAPQSDSALYQVTKYYVKLRNDFFDVPRPQAVEEDDRASGYERYIEAAFGVPLMQATNKSAGTNCRKEDFWDFERCKWADKNPCPRAPYRVC